MRVKTINDLMSTKVISVHPETPLMEAANILARYNFNGLPVLDNNDTLVGILTEYDLIIKGSAVHLPTFMKLLSQFDLYRKDRGLIRDDIKKIFDMRVKDVMNHEPFVLPEDTSIEEAFRAFSEHHRINPIPIINRDRKVVGILSRFDLNKLFGSPVFFLGKGDRDRDIDKSVNLFLKNFERQFIFVSRFRAHSWLIVSLLFAIVGYLIAWFWILRIV